MRCNIYRMTYWKMMKMSNKEWTEELLNAPEGSLLSLYMKLGEKIYCKTEGQFVPFTIACVMSPTGVKFPILSTPALSVTLELNQLMIKIKNIMMQHLNEVLDKNLDHNECEHK